MISPFIHHSKMSCLFLTHLPPQSVAVTGHLRVVVDGVALVERLMPKRLNRISSPGREAGRRKGKEEEEEEKGLRRRMRRSEAGGEENIKGRWLQGLPGSRQLLEENTAIANRCSMTIDL